MYDRVLYHVKSGLLEKCSDWDSVAQSWENQSETVEESGEGLIFLVAENQVVPPCPLRLTSEKRPSTPSTAQESGEFLRYVV